MQYWVNYTAYLIELFKKKLNNYNICDILAQVHYTENPLDLSILKELKNKVIGKIKVGKVWNLTLNPIICDRITIFKINLIFELRVQKNTENKFTFQLNNPIKYILFFYSQGKINIVTNYRSSMITLLTTIVT